MDDLNSLKEAGSLPPIPFAPFDESIYDRVSPKSKVIFRVLHRIVRDNVVKSQGYKNMGLDILKALIPVLDKPKLLSHGKIKGEKNIYISRAVSALLDKEKGLPKVFNGQLPGSDEIDSALTDYEDKAKAPLGDKPPEMSGDRFVHFGPSQKTITVAPVRVPWSNLKFPGFIRQEFAGVQKSAPIIRWEKNETQALLHLFDAR